MPNLDSLDRFKRTVNSLGNEPEILEQRGETFEDVERPSQGLPEDLSELLGAPAEEEGADLSALLDSFEEEEQEEEQQDGQEEQSSDEPSEEPSEGPYPEREGVEEEPFDEFDLDALIDETSTEPREAEMGSPGEEAGGMEEDFDLEIGDTSDEDVDIDIDADFAELGEEAAEGLPEESSGEPAGAAEEEFEIPEFDEGFDDEFEAAPEEAPEEAPAEEPPEEAPEEPFEEPLGEDFDIDADLADLGLDELDVEPPEETEEPFEEAPEEAPEETAPQAEELAEEVEIPEEEAGEIETPDIEEELGSFDLGDFEEDFGAGELFDEGEPPEAGEVQEEVEEWPEEEEAFVPEVPEEIELPEEEIEFEEPPVPGEDEPPEEAPEEFGEMEIPDIDLDAVPDAEDFEMPAELGGSGGDEELDQFNLDTLGEEFALGEEELSEEELNPAVAVAGELEEAEEEFHLSDNDFKKLRRTLGFLPRNLKVAVEELIGEKGLSGDDLSTLTDALVDGESPKVIAGIVGEITGKKIKIPSQFELRSGAEFEEERDSFTYIFRNRVLPYLKVGLAALVVLGFLGFLGYRYLYTPLHAGSLYRQGYEALQEDRYETANNYFDEAVDTQAKRQWFFRYADGFIDKKQYYLAGEKYEQLLAYFPGDREAFIDYAVLESEVLGDYQGAEEHLDRILDEELYHYDALLYSGDNYMRWAAHDPGKFEDARLAYAKLMQEYGMLDELSFRMLRYFIRTDNYDEVIRLKEHFLNKPNTEVNPRIYAELGGYLISNNQLADVKDILFAAQDVDESIPEVHYHLARYFRDLEDYTEEDKALVNAIHYFEEAEPLGQDRIGMLVDAYNRSGESFYRRQEFLTAEQQFQKGIRLYEDALDRRLLGPASTFGKLYANLGDVYYYISGSLDTALELYTEAQDNLYSTPSIRYKKGFINYSVGNYERAVMEFYQASEGFSMNKNLMFATANTLYHQEQYFAAQGYYNHLLDVLERQEANIPFLMVEERDDHRSLVEYFMKVYNNLGVTLNRLSERSPDQEKYSRSLAYLTRSTEYSDFLTRNPETLERSAALDLAYLNSRAILYPLAENELQLYSRLPRDMEEFLF